MTFSLALPTRRTSHIWPQLLVKIQEKHFHIVGSNDWSNPRCLWWALEFWSCSFMDTPQSEVYAYVWRKRVVKDGLVRKLFASSKFVWFDIYFKFWIIPLTHLNTSSALFRHHGIVISCREICRKMKLAINLFVVFVCCWQSGFTLA